MRRFVMLAAVFVMLLVSGAVWAATPSPLPPPRPTGPPAGSPPAVRPGTRVPGPTTAPQPSPLPATKPGGPTATPDPRGTPLFADEFNGMFVDQTKWAFPTDADGLGGHDAHWDAAACTVSNGALHITAAPINGVLSSCALWTQGREAMPAYGYWEMRADIPSEVGTWPAFWSVAYDRLTDSSLYGWEIDTMEAIDHVVADNQTVSWNLYVRESGGTIDDFFAAGMVSAVYDGFHTYAIDWRADHLAWFVDGVQRFRVDEGQVIGGKTVHIPSMRQVLIVQMALGSFSGTFDPSHVPQVMDVDYVRVYP